MTTTEITMTEQVVASMLVEPTGRHFLDSGGAYGRDWERNQGTTVADWKAQPRAWISSGDFITVSVFHYLTERLEYSPEWQARFDAFAERDDQQDNPWLATVEEFYGELTGFTEAEAARERAATPEQRYHGTWRKREPWNTYNSYNHENNLSQTIQWSELEVPELDELFDPVTRTTVHLPTVEQIAADYPHHTNGFGTQQLVMLQIHGGADVRGGYTKPKAFILQDSDAPIGYDMDSFELYCSYESEDTTEPLPGMPHSYPERHYMSYRSEWVDNQGCSGRSEDFWPEPVDPEGHGSYAGDYMYYDDENGTHIACPYCLKRDGSMSPMEVDAAYVG